MEILLDKNITIVKRQKRSTKKGRPLLFYERRSAAAAARRHYNTICRLSLFQIVW